MEHNKAISFSITGNKDSANGHKLLLGIGEHAKTSKDRSIFKGNSHYYSICNTNEFVEYKIKQSNVFGVGRDGSMDMSIYVPINHDIYNGSNERVSPYIVLREVYEAFINANMKYSNYRKKYVYIDEQISKQTFQSIINKYTLKYRPGKVVTMSTDDSIATVFVDSEDDIKTIFLDTQYNEFKNYGEIVVATKALGQEDDSSVILNVSIPRPVHYTVYLNEKEYCNVKDVNQECVVDERYKRPYYTYQTIYFNINTLLNGNKINGIVRFDPVNEIIHCRIDPIPQTKDCYLQIGDSENNIPDANFIVKIEGDVYGLSNSNFILKDIANPNDRENIKSGGVFRLSGDDLGKQWEVIYSGVGHYKISGGAISVNSAITNKTLNIQKYNPYRYFNIGSQFERCSKIDGYMTIKVDCDGNFDTRLLTLHSGNNTVRYSSEIEGYSIDEAMVNNVWTLKYNQHIIIQGFRWENKGEIVARIKPPIGNMTSTRSQLPSTPQKINEKDNNSPKQIKLSINLEQNINLINKQTTVILKDSDRTFIFKEKAWKIENKSLIIPLFAEMYNMSFEVSIETRGYECSYSNKINITDNDVSCQLHLNKKRGIGECIRSNFNILILSLLFLCIIAIGFLTYKIVTYESPVVNPEPDPIEQQDNPSPPQNLDEPTTTDTKATENREELLSEISNMIESIKNSSVKPTKVDEIRRWIKTNESTIEDEELNNLSGLVLKYDSMVTQYNEYYKRFESIDFVFSEIGTISSWYNKTKWTNAYNNDKEQKLTKRIDAYEALNNALNASTNNNRLDGVKTVIQNINIYNDHIDLLKYFTLPVNDSMRSIADKWLINGTYTGIGDINNAVSNIKNNKNPE